MSKNLMTDKQGLRIVKEAQKLGVTSEQFQGRRGDISAVLKAIRDDSVITIVESPIIIVDRQKNLDCPDFADRVLYGELENVGPERIDASKLEPWRHPSQKINYVSCDTVCSFLMSSGEIKSCIGRREIFAIRAKGLSFFRRYITKDGYRALAFKGLVERSRPCNPGLVGLYVPFLENCCGELISGWHQLEGTLNLYQVIPRFRA